MGTLYVIGTPIGNLKDISLRALEVLKEVELVFAEDTRVTKKLLSRFNLHPALKRYNEHMPEKTFREAQKILASGGRVALVSDSGTPGISDPGVKLVDFVRNNLPEVKIEVLPGASAAIAALSVSGLPANEFTFLGFPPAKRKRKKFFEKVRDVEVRPVVLYESPHRLKKTLEGLADVFDNEKEIFIAREMTKIYEEYFKGTIAEAINYFGEGRGEFVIVIP